MISLKELNPHNYPTTPEIDKNLNTLLLAINIVRSAYNIAMTVTSGLRSQADQQRINPSAPLSKHLLGAAVDISDTSGQLWQWCKDHMNIIEKAGLYLEDMDYIRAKDPSKPKWVHFQCIAPGSKKRIFIP